MEIAKERSKRFADCIKNLYEKKMYSVEYAILQLEKFRDNNKIIESDYEEYYNYFCNEMDKQNTVIEENTENEQIEDDNRSMPFDTVQNEEIENKEEVESAE